MFPRKPHVCGDKKCVNENAKEEGESEADELKYMYEQKIRNHAELGDGIKKFNEKNVLLERTSEE